MEITRTKASEIFKEVTKDNENTKVTKIGNHIKSVFVIYDNWEYTFIFYDNILKKIEEYNHRELIEVYVK